MEHEEAIVGKVLILEDERQIVMELRDALSLRDLKAIVVDTIADAMLQLQNLGHVDAIWLDHHILGRADGLNFILQVKKDSRSLVTPIYIVSSGVAGRSYIKLGAGGYEIKSDQTITEIIDDIVSILHKTANN